MRRRSISSCLWFLLGLVVSAGAAGPPNVVIVFCDDLGYGDVGCFGAKGYKTPNIDRLAREGMRFTDFYVPQAVCSASRAALLTGCYPNRLGILGALGPNAKVALNTNEWTIARMLKGRGYATAMFGKWHLGRPAPYLPPSYGFDEYFGLPYSNDMWPRHPETPTNYPPLPLLEGTNVVQLMPDQSQLTTWYTERAVKFIEANRARPFFLYLAHNMPHVPLFVSEKFKGKSRRGLFGDVIEELDWSVGEVLAALKRFQLDANTLVIFTSDNGPWLSYGDHAGSTGGLREGKATEFEGGVREPFIARWPGHIPAGKTCREAAMTIDLLPTIAKLTGGALSTNRIDGLDIWPLLSAAPGAKSPHDVLLFYWNDELHAVRSGPWKLHLPHPYVRPVPPGNGGRPGRMMELRTSGGLYNLETDPAEKLDLLWKDPKLEAIARSLFAAADKASEDLGNSLTRRKGSGVREPARFEVPGAKVH